MEEINISAECPHCGKDLLLAADVNLTPMDLAPNVRSLIKPIGSIFVYRISSEEIKQFILQKSKKYVPDVLVEIAPRYCERKRRKETDPHRSYASLRIAFSDNIIERKDELGWYGKIGENNGEVRVVESLYSGIIRRYQYDRRAIEGWMKSYKTLEELEEGLGMTEAYINDLRLYSTPQRVPTSTKESWVIFSAAPENIIADMLQDQNSGKLPGRIIIQDVIPINKDVVEFTVHLNPSDMKLRENPHVRQILLGEEKPKK